MKHTVAILAAATLVSCGSGDYLHTDADTQRAATMPSDDEILKLVYDNGYDVPEDFFVDARADTPRSYTLYHVKDASISYELCTNDYYEALAWENADNDSRAVGGYYVGSVENDRYFEIVRELSFDGGIGNISDLTSPGFARVFKCSNVNRDGVDRTLRNGYAGTLNGRPLTAASLRNFTEYMWQFTFFAPARKKVLRSFSTETVQTWGHTLRLALATNQGTGRCDLIDVVDWVFTVDKSSGAINKTFDAARSLQAQLLDGVPRIC